MTQHFSKTATIVGSLLVSASPSWADVTAADVWANYTAFYTATGAVIEGALGADGIVASPALVYSLPFGAGVIRADLPAMTFSDNGDGTVNFQYPDAFDIRISADSSNQPPVNIVLSMTQTGHTATASGTPGDITYTQSAEAFTLTVKSFDAPNTEGMTLDANMSSQGYTVTSQVTEGDLITATSDMTLQPAEIAYSFEVMEGEELISAKSSVTYGTNQTTSEIILPANGSNILNLTPAFAAGMSLSMRSEADGNTSQAITMLGDVLISDQTTSTGPSLATLMLNAAGLNLDFSAADFAMRFNQPDVMPFPVDVTAASASGGYIVPTMASAEPQDVGVRFGLTGLEIGEALWSLIDAGAVLPRDPVDLNFDLAAKVISNVDLFDIMALEQNFSGATVPGSIESVALTDLAFSALGAAAQATGAFTFDNTDLATFGGLPRPEGDAIVTVSGAEALLERLESLGFITAEDASGARLAKGIFGRATGDDAFETQLEINAEGHVLVNGQRIQ